MNKIRKGDEVIILTGRDKKRRGIVSAVVGKEHLLVDGINVVKKHLKANPMSNNPGGITSKSMPIHISNVALFNKVTGKGERVLIKELDGVRTRIFRSDGSSVDNKS